MDADAVRLQGPACDRGHGGASPYGFTVWTVFQQKPISEDEMRREMERGPEGAWAATRLPFDEGPYAGAAIKPVTRPASSGPRSALWGLRRWVTSASVL